MIIEEIQGLLCGKFGDKISPIETGAVHDSCILVDPTSIDVVCQYLCDDERLAFDMLMCLSGVDLSPEDEDLSVVYHLFSDVHLHKVVIKAVVSKENPHLPTVENIWKTANWHEREAYDLFGIVFDGHSDLRRILLPDDWEGHPLRKNYKEPDTYRGMKVPY